MQRFIQGGGGGGGDKYYKKVINTAVAAKRYAHVQKHLECFQMCILAVKTLVLGR